MARPQSNEARADFVSSSLNYLVAGGEKTVTYVAQPGFESKHTGHYEKRTVSIFNGRHMRDDLSLDRQGFVFVRHETRVSNFYNDSEVRAVYYREIEELVKNLTGAARVLMFDHTLRAQDRATQVERRVREPVQTVHNDYTEWSGPKRVRDLLPPDEAEALLQHRFAVIQVWRPIRGPVQSAPLAISDAQSIRPEDLVINERRYPDRIGQTYRLKYSPDHRWFYFPNMQTNEALVFKCYDSERDGRARFTAHSSFDDPGSPPDAAPRESIEARTLAFFR